MALIRTGYCDTDYHDLCPGTTPSRPQCVCKCHGVEVPEQPNKPQQSKKKGAK